MRERESATLVYLEAKARAKQAEEKALRLEAAVAAMNGQPIEQRGVSAAASGSETGATIGGAGETSAPPSKRKRRPKPAEDNPLAHLKCAGCGSRGSMSENVIQAPSGAYVRMLICGECNNQSLMG